MPVGGQHKLAALQYQQAHHAAGYLLYEKEHEQDDERGEAGEQAEKHRYLGQLVGDRVYRFTERRDHVEAARDNAVRRVADTGEQQHERGSEIVFQPAICPDKNGDQHHAENRQNIGYRPYPILAGSLVHPLRLLDMHMSQSAHVKIFIHWILQHKFKSKSTPVENQLIE